MESGKVTGKLALASGFCALVIIAIFTAMPDYTKNIPATIVVVLATCGGIASFALLFIITKPKIKVAAALLATWIIGTGLENLGGAFRGIGAVGFWYLLAAIVGWVASRAINFANNPAESVENMLLEIAAKLGLMKREIVIGEKLAELNDRATHKLEGWGWSKWQELMVAEHRRNEYEWKGAEGSFGIDPFAEANPHINISGVSGYGKSTLCRVIVKGIHEQCRLPVVVLDVHNEYSGIIRETGGRVIDAKTTQIGLWELEEETPQEKILENTAILERLLDLGDVQAYYLAKCAEKAYTKKDLGLESKATTTEVPSMKDVIGALDAWIESEKKPEKSLVTLRRRLANLELSGVFGEKTEMPFSEMLSTSTDIKMAGVKSTAAQALYTEVFLRKLYHYMVTREKIDGVRLFVLIDEAQNVCRRGKEEGSFAAKITAEARKYGIGLIISNQMAQDMDKNIIGNCAVTFAFYQKEPFEANYIIELMTGPDYGRKVEVNKQFHELQKWECITITTKQRKPLKVRVRPLERGKEEDTAEERGMEGEWKGKASEEAAEKKRPKERTDKEIMAGMIAKALEERNIRYARSNSQHEPDIVIRRGNKKIAVDLEDWKKKPSLLKKQVAHRLKSYDEMVIVVDLTLEKHYRKAAFGTKARVMSVNGFIGSLGR